MIPRELTDRAPLATTLPMQGRSKRGRVRGHKVMLAAGMLVTGSLATGGCISVNAPDKPIVIELNINIQQEVVYRLAADADKTIEKNPEIF
ncbi:YnbE family lipoprotein [Novosphingobium flavum]|uniref:YnbE family lipoprotein n=1 Tax=Novosphingobium aerophilum TaxID=2839843 RepID=UPI00163AB92E|nr:YnbE family lipoprotein [Novosphingobium aerophilum]MBC2660879.1 YnbE family lipoprotein [Novosphingobium aerophilum]